MSICRWSSDGGLSDVYVFESNDGGVYICVNAADDFDNPENGNWYECPNYQEAVDRLSRLERSGVYVPNSAYTNLEERMRLAGGAPHGS